MQLEAVGSQDDKMNARLDHSHDCMGLISFLRGSRYTLYRCQKKHFGLDRMSEFTTAPSG